ncbi:hypothetical protein Mapa_003071 [Marchantia paleacea]|nr:hypothetical protein Mapa_003071 [Marchantia paleacea]
MEPIPRVPDSDVNDSIDGTEESIKILHAIPESSPVNPPQPKVPQRARDWNLRELKVLIAAKRNEHEQSLLEQGGSEQAKLTSRKNKWEKIAQYVVKEGVCNPVRDGEACKKKWATVSKDFKRVYDHEKHVPAGQRSYWNMNTSERRKRSRPLNFPEELYREMEEWLPKRMEEWPVKRLEGTSQAPGPQRNGGESSKPLTLEALKTDTLFRPILPKGPANVFSPLLNAITPVDRAAVNTPTPDAGLDESISTLPTTSPTKKNIVRDDRLKNKRKRTCNGATRAMSEAVVKLVEVLKDDIVRKNKHDEKTMEWEKQHKTEHLALLRDQMESRAKVEMVQAQSFNILAQALAKLVEKDNNNPNNTNK